MQKYSKAVAAFVTAIVAILGALAANGILPGDWGRTVSIVIAALIPVLTAAGVYLAPANQQ